jgi:hypothetical protein
MGLYGATHYYFADTESTRASPFLECRNFSFLGLDHCAQHALVKFWRRSAETENQARVQLEAGNDTKQLDLLYF